MSTWLDGPSCSIQDVHKLPLDRDQPGAGGILPLQLMVISWDAVSNMGNMAKKDISAATD